MKIEIVGLPGSGKTTLSKKLYDNINILHISIKSIDFDMKKL